MVCDPKPGSSEAVKKGCTCPVIDNHYGRGYHHWPGKPEEDRVWMVYGDCPLHNKDGESVTRKETNHD